MPATPRDAKLRLIAAPRDGTLRAVPSATWAELRVRDTGIGIPAAELEAVFEPFTRGSNVESVIGTGVGLAAARHTVEQHGGTIGIESMEGAGTTVTVRLPLAEPGDGGPSSASQTAHNRGT